MTTKGSSAVLASLALALVSCETGELNTGGSFDPLSAPGSGRSIPTAATGLRPGSFARTLTDNAAFFSKRPKGDAQADRQLPANTEVKVISDDGSFVKVELNSGEVGFIPSVLVSDQSAADPATSPDAIQVYPPVPGTLPTGVPDPSIPTIPPVIDPEAPAIPDVPPVPVEEAPPVPPPSTPLPPGVGEEELPPVESGNF